MTGPARMLVVNAGSSSVKLRVLDGQDGKNRRHRIRKYNWCLRSPWLLELLL